MDCYYVDKTPHVLRLTREGKYHFLSRPRRFGKSLLVDTLKELFEGNGELFQGLAIHGQWDWAVKHPVVRISFGSGEYCNPDGVREDAADQLAVMERKAKLGRSDAGPPIRFRASDQGIARALRTAGCRACGRIRQAHPGHACGPGGPRGRTGTSCAVFTG